MSLLTASQCAALIANGKKRQTDEAFDPWPVLKLFTPDAGATWLLSELDPDDPDQAFGLCDLGLGCPELGYVSLAELATVRGQLGLPVEQDRFWHPTKSLAAYADEARAVGQIAA